LLRVLMIAGAIVLCWWLILAVAARTLPSGPLRDLAGFLPACVTVARRLRR
jgi:hypothetical protein